MCRIEECICRQLITGKWEYLGARITEKKTLFQSKIDLRKWEIDHEIMLRDCRNCAKSRVSTPVRTEEICLHENSTSTTMERIISRIRMPSPMFIIATKIAMSKAMQDELIRSSKIKILKSMKWSILVIEEVKIPAVVIIILIMMMMIHEGIRVVDGNKTNHRLKTKSKHLNEN